jgi:hypothetical protein
LNLDICIPSSNYLNIKRNSQDFEFSETSKFSWDRSCQVVVV